jgi:hypothetical protein
MTDATDLRMAPDPTPAAFERLAAERDQQERSYRHERQRAESLLSRLAQAEVERDQLLAQRDALTARLAWAEGELGKIWAALRDAR